MTPLIRILSGAVLVAASCPAQSPSPVFRPAEGAAVVDAKFLRAAALEVDKRMAAHYRKHNLPVPPDANEATLLRRTYLVAVGRIPTLAEARAYFADTAKDKHARLVETLLASPGYASHMTNWLMDLLRVKDRFADNVSAAPYVDYLRAAVAENKPWDVLSSELLTASGEGWNGAPQIGYFVRDKGMPLDNTANTMRIFLGTRMECAQCHDHPYADWSRRDFFELAAFFHGIQDVNQTVRYEAVGQLRDNDGKVKPEHRELYEFAERTANQAHYFSVAGGGAGNIPLPQDYQYRDGKPGEAVGARAPFGPSKRMSARRERDDGRERFVSWMVDPENPRFTQIIANRMWKRVMGRGLTEPVDEFVAVAQTPVPDMVGYLNSLMRQTGYDLRAFQQALLLTRSFRFDTNPSLAEGSDPNTLAGRQLDRLSAEQLWDSLLVLATGDAALDKPARKAVATGGSDGTPMAALQRDLLASKDARDYLAVLRKAMENAGSSSSMMMQGGQPAATGLVRASELPYPPPGDHFLRRFGASDREVIDGSTKEGAVPQVLSLVNGEAQKILVENPSAAIFKTLEKEPDDEARVRALFLSVFTREPDAAEVDMMLLQLAATGPERGWRNMLAALLCTHEFLFLR